MEVKVIAHDLTCADVQALALAVYEGEKAGEGILRELDAVTGGVIASVFRTGEMTGKEGETVLVHLPDSVAGLFARRVLLVGVGERGEYGSAQVSQMAAVAKGPP